ncbi:NAD(P)/FAD-dependent oxidoreductase [Candidatus Dependentiae bacterium]
MKKIKQKIAIIIGAGPAGLTAAYELLKKTDIQPIIYEQDYSVGGLSKTVKYKGNRIDIGGHRFFSKSSRVNEWWENFLDLQDAPSKDEIILNKDFKTKGINDPELTDNILLKRSRLSRIFFLRSFFDYPISLSFFTLYKLGFLRVSKIGFSYIKACVFPIKKEKTLEDFFINRFGKELYLTFFKDYTQKVWGVPCDKIDASWGAQRIKGLSISKAILHALKSIIIKNKKGSQKSIETTLIGSFKYPKFGPGQLWENVAKEIVKKGGKIFLNHKAVGLKNDTQKILSVSVQDLKTNERTEFFADYVFSTMPIKDLVSNFDNKIPDDVKNVAKGLVYRDFITVGLLLKKLKVKNQTKIKTVNNIIPDNWIYIQEKDVCVGRIQIFNNWSPYLVKDLNNVWIGLEYFCNQGDKLWNKKDTEFKKFAIDELIKIGFIEKSYVLDGVVIRVPKTYPAYFGTYKNFDIVKNFLDRYQNLFLIGRNGMHRYNNMDHSMITAMQAVENIVKDEKSKMNIWSVNSEKEYHEEK